MFTILLTFCATSSFDFFFLWCLFFTIIEPLLFLFCLCVCVCVKWCSIKKVKDLLMILVDHSDFYVQENIEILKTLASDVILCVCVFCWVYTLGFFLPRIWIQITVVWTDDTDTSKPWFLLSGSERCCRVVLKKYLYWICFFCWEGPVFVVIVYCCCCLVVFCVFLSLLLRVCVCARAILIPIGIYMQEMKQKVLKYFSWN